MALVSQAELEARLGRSLTSEEASAFTVINIANQAYIEKIISSGVESVSETTRSYDGGVQHLAIDPCTAITAVKYVDDDDVTESTFDTSDYTVEPKNNTLKTMIRNRGAKFSRGMNNVTVTAKFSIYDDTNVLNVIKDALLSALENEINDTSNIKKESIEGYSIEFANSQTKSTLDKVKYLFPGI